jgi:Polyketide cyclase / dehydrase and lipid transport
MQDHRFSFDIDATPEQVWSALHPPVRRRAEPGKPRVIEHGGVRIEVLYEGDERGEGLIRHCTFRVPRYLLSGGVAQSWEWVTPVVPNVSSHYEAIGKPLFSRAEGWQRLEDLGGGRTRVHFRETYHVFNPILRFLLERRVHRFISKDNDRLIRAAIEHALARGR